MKKRFLKRAVSVLTVAAMVVSSGYGYTGVSAQAEESETRAGGEEVKPDIASDLVGYYDFNDSLENGASTTGGKATLHGGADVIMDLLDADGNVIQDADGNPLKITENYWNVPATGSANYENSKEDFGKAYHFLGDTVDENSNVIRGEGLQLDAKITGTEYTVSFWVNPEDYGKTEFPENSGIMVNGSTRSLVFANHDPDSCFSVNSLNGFRGTTFLGKLWDWDNRNTNFVCLDGDNTDNGKADIGKWTMVTVTCKSGEQKLYFDGVEKASAASTNANVIETLKDQDIFLGINWWDPSFKGLIDEVCIYNRVLTADEVAALYQKPEGIPTGVKISNPSSDGEKITNEILYETEADMAADSNGTVTCGTYQCKAGIVPESVTNKTFTWSVSPTEKATISADGLVTLNDSAQDGDTITVRATFDADDTIYDERTLTVAVKKSVVGVDKEITDEDIKNYYNPVNRKRVSVHDPSIIKDEDGTYYIFGSHMAWAKSTDLENWTTFTNNINKDYKTLFAKEFEWAAAGDSVYNPDGNLWAPDVIWNPDMNKWCMYMSINGCSWNSCICLLTADSLSGDWTYVGPVVYSGFTASGTHDFNKTDYKTVTGSGTLDSKFISGEYKPNDGQTPCEPTTWSVGYGAHAIDPCVFYDENGKLWFTYGSWSGGIYIFELDKTTGFRNTTQDAKNNYTDAYMGKKIAGGGAASGEASYIEHIGNYYYLFVSYGGLLANGGYQMRVFRSANPDGPYVDVSGDNADGKGCGDVNGSVGTRLMSYYKWSWWDDAHVAQGHNSAFVDDDGNAYVFYHTRSDDGTEGHSVRVHQLFTTENDYLVAAPFEYSKSDSVSASGYNTDEIAGTYEVLFQRNTNSELLEYNKSQVIELNADGTVTGDVTGSWINGAGKPYVSLEIDGVKYEGTFVEQSMEGTDVKTLCFTTVGNNDVCMWGAKYPSDMSVVAWASSDLKIPSAISSDLKLETQGRFGSTIEWKSSDETILGNDGTVKGILGTVTLTATIRKGNYYHVISKEVKVTPKSALEKVIVAEYFTDGAKDLTVGIKEGTYQYANPYNKAGLDISNGVSISFDYERNGDDIAKLGAILSFRVKANDDPKMFFTDGTYLGYNAYDGNWFDANNNYDNMIDFIGKGKKQVEIVLETSGFTINVDGKKAYDTDDFNAGTITNGINENKVVDYASMLNWLNKTADELNFGWGSFWTADVDAVKAKISNVKFCVFAEQAEVLESISLDYTKLELKVGDTKTLTVNRKPALAGTGSVKWESADKSIATVDANGKVTGISKGTTTITATLDGKTATCTVVVEASSSSGGNSGGGSFGGGGSSGGGGGGGSSTSSSPSPSPTSVPTATKIPSSEATPSPTTETGVDDSGNGSITSTPDNENNTELSVDDSKNTNTDNNKKTVSYNKNKYDITSNKSKTIAYKKPASNVGSKVKIPATVKITENGKKVTYKVTSIKNNAFKGNKKVKQVTVGKNIKTIGKNAFKNCSKMKKIKIKSKSIKKIGKNAFKGVSKKCVIEVPKSKKKAYTKMLRKAGLNKKVKIVGK